MPGFFRSLFRTSRETREPTPSRPLPPIEQMSVDEISAYIQSKGDELPARQCGKLIPRLYNIALYDHHLPAQQRNFALKLAQALIADAEKGLSDNPAALSSLQAGIKIMVD